MGLFSHWPSCISEVSRSASLSVDGGRDETVALKNAASLCCSLLLLFLKGEDFFCFCLSVSKKGLIRF